MSVGTGSKTASFNSLFDGPDGGGIIEGRNQSIVAPQALFLRNDVWIDQVSGDCAICVFADSGISKDMHAPESQPFQIQTGVWSPATVRWPETHRGRAFASDFRKSKETLQRRHSSRTAANSQHRRSTDGGEIHDT